MNFRQGITVWKTAFALGGRSTWRWGVLGMVAGLAAFGFDVLFAITLQRFFVSIGLVQGGGETAVLGAIGSGTEEAALFLLAGLLRAGLAWVNNVATGISQVAFESAARQKIVQWALWEGRTSSGRVATLFNDVVVHSGGAVSTSYYLLGRLLMIAAAFLTLLTYSAFLTGIVALILVAALPLHRQIDRRISGASTTIQRSLAATSDRLMQGVKNSIFLHIHGMFGKEVVGQHRLVGQYERASRRYYGLASARAIVPQMLGLFVVVVIAIKGAGVFTENKADLVAYLYLVMRFFQALSDAARVTANIRGTWPRLEVLTDWHVAEFAPATARMDAALSESRTRPAVPDFVGLRLEDVSFSWGDAGKVLNRASIDFPAGSATVILGPSGAGKTTLLLLLSRLVAPDQGRVIATLPDGAHDLADVRQKVLSATAYVGPDPFVISGSIRDFMRYGQDRETGDDEMHHALKQAHCEFVPALPGGLDYQISEQGAGLSAGQKQRLAIARALLRRPRLLLLDEATSNLDAGSEQAIIDAVRGLHGMVTVVAVTHREALRAIADTILIVEGGGSVRLEPDAGAGAAMAANPSLRSDGTEGSGIEQP